MMKGQLVAPSIGKWVELASSPAARHWDLSGALATCQCISL